MYVSKYPNPENYRSLTPEELTERSRWGHVDDDILCFSMSDAAWDDGDGFLSFPNNNRESLSVWEAPGSNVVEGIQGELVLLPRQNDDGSISLLRNKRELLNILGFSQGGRQKSSWMIRFKPRDDYHYYGLGEKSGALEHRGRQVTFWNSDVMGDFPMEHIQKGMVDPLYISIPYLLIRAGEDGWIGIFLDNMYRSFVSVAANPHIETVSSSQIAPQLYFSAENGQPRFAFFAADNPAEVTRIFQRFLGSHQRPPFWSLGHQQCRWGYGSPKDLDSVRKQFASYKIPNDGLWLDIDYMDEYRVFTFDPEFFPNVKEDIQYLQAEGQSVVPILDPGIKLDPDFPLYQEGAQNDYFCKNSLGDDYVGYVWPGQTVFPDFSLEEVGEWWADHVSKLIRLGFRGFWVDMNDPSTGSADPAEMLFQRGNREHGYFHNSYALGMQKATHLGFQKAAPDLRPFILSRSASPGSSRYAAVWLGDNISNYHHLAQTIITGMNLSLSGIAFWGADIPGFGGDADEELMVDWYKSAFLQPFFRNHSCSGTASQEPWSFGSRVRNIVGHFIRLRYRFLPYLYNLFVAHEANGEPLLTPLWYHFPDSFDQCWDLGDQFMVGPAVMQAPIVHRGQRKRRVYLPSGWWFDASEGTWVKGGKWIQAEAGQKRTPLFFREDSAFPLLSRLPKSNQSDPSDIEIHLVLRRKSRHTIEGSYISDDGLTRGYTRGNQTHIEFRVMTQGDGVEIYLEHRMQGHGPLRIAFVLYDDFDRVVLHSSSGKLHGRELGVKPVSQTLSGEPLNLLKTKSFVFHLR